MNKYKSPFLLPKLNVFGKGKSTAILSFLDYEMVKSH